MNEQLPGIDVAEPPSDRFAPPAGRVVRVQPDIASITRSFDYEVPVSWEADGRAERVRIGSLVRIDFHGRRTRGWIVEDDVVPSGQINIRPLAKWSSVGPPAEVVDLATWAAWRWAGRVPHILRAASPPKMVQEVRSPFELPRVDPPEAQRRAFDAPLTLVQTTPFDDGSGLALAAASLGRALILVPTVMHRQALAALLRARNIPVAEYPDEWERSAAGAVTIGTRLGAWAPVPDLAAILVLDEHDGALKEERTPSWNARDVAIERAQRCAIPCVLASPSPSLEALEATTRRLVPDRSAVRSGWPVIEVIDMRKVETPGLLTAPIVPLLRGDGPVACILNRKGRARMLACASCNSLATCDACTAAVIQPDDQFSCASCGTTRPVVCRECGGTAMKLIRPGISRLAEELEALAKTDVVQVTAETPPRDLLGDRLLIGTEALLHRLPHARVVIFLDFDQELAVPRSRASEDAFALLALAARRVGRRHDGGRVVIQTRRPDDPVVQAAVHGDPDRVARSQRDIRKVFSQPPYGAWAVASGAGAAEFVEELREAPLKIDRLGDRWRFSAPTHETLLDALAAAPRPHERLRLEIDPLSI